MRDYYCLRLKSSFQNCSGSEHCCFSLSEDYLEYDRYSSTSSLEEVVFNVMNLITGSGYWIGFVFALTRIVIQVILIVFFGRQVQDNFFNSSKSSSNSFEDPTNFFLILFCGQSLKMSPGVAFHWEDHLVCGDWTGMSRSLFWKCLGCGRRD